MNIVCAWCGKEITNSYNESVPERQISHGICEKCYAEIESSFEIPLTDYLNSLPLPIALVDQDGTVVTANRPLQSLLNKDLSHIGGFKGGDVFECPYASLPEGCGNTIHCSACTIRITVMDTYNTGIPHYRRLAYLNQGTLNDINQIILLITTVKSGNYVLLRIDEIDTSKPK